MTQGERGFNTSHVKVNPATVRHFCDVYPRFNTSHVKVKLVFPNYFMPVNFVSIHPMLKLIPAL